MLAYVRTPEAFFTIVWTIVTYLHKNMKIAKAKKIIDLFEVSDSDQL